jgi:hypothetical protein
MIENLTVLEALEKYPNQEEYAFHLNGDKDCIYFRTEDEEPINSSLPNGLLCTFNCIKLFSTGQVLLTKLYIKKQDEITPISFSKMKIEFEAGLAKIKAITPPNLMSNKSLKIYLTMGFNVNK